MEIKPIAKIYTQFPAKFGIPRQSGLADTVAKIVFEPEYRAEEALRGIDGYSHLWLIWEFTEAKSEKWSPTVRPPRLGGNTRMGVFATRSPYRPNSLGLSLVELLSVEKTPGEGSVLIVKGADILDGTPVYDIKPYLPYVEAHPEARGGFAAQVTEDSLSVVLPADTGRLSEEELKTLTQILRQDPRPHYQDDPAKEYAFEFAGHNIRFVCDGDILRVTGIAALAE